MLLFAATTYAQDQEEIDEYDETEEVEEGELDLVQERQREELFLLMDVMEQNLGTVEVFVSADSLYNKAREYGDSIRMRYALMTKLTGYLSISDYDRVVTYADSIIEALDLERVGQTDYFYAVYVKIIGYIEQGKYKIAIQNAQRLYEDGKRGIDLTSLRNLCNALICLGLANSEMSLYNEALKYYTECIDALTERDPENRLIMVKLEAETYRMQTAQKISDKTVALKYIDTYHKELQDFEKVRVGTDHEALFVGNFYLLMHFAYIDIYCDTKNVEKAREHIRAVDELINSSEWVVQYRAELHELKAKYYHLVNRNTLAIAHADSAISFYRDISKPKSEFKSLRYKLDALHAAQLYSQEYDVANRMLLLNDSLSEQRYNSSIEEMQTLMDVDKLELRAQTLETQQQLLEVKAETLQTQRQLWIFISLSVVLAAFVGFVLFKRKRDQEKQRILSEQKRLLEEEVERQTHELREQKEEIEQKNRDITDSINYALRIQSSILPDFNNFNTEGIAGVFALFIPCHIVSGDFYWANRTDDRLTFACADCTGHGVPGAFMTMIGTTILNDLCKRTPALAPNEMLEQLHTNLLAVLQQSGGKDSRDGMDIAILEYNISTRHIRVSGARRPIYIYAGGERHECKTVKRSIGERDYTRETLPFGLDEFDVAEGDTVYMCSDGLPDQFGGPTEHGKRLKTSGLVKMLDKIEALPIEQQHDVLRDLYYEWRGNCPQFDDISLVGIRF